MLTVRFITRIRNFCYCIVNVIVWKKRTTISFSSRFVEFSNFSQRYGSPIDVKNTSKVSTLSTESAYKKASIYDHIEEFTARLPRWKRDFLHRWNKELTPIFSRDNFDMVYDIGSGGFGRVVLARHRDNGSQYALKIVEKRHVVKTGHINHFRNEIRTLNSVRFRFLIHMSFFFLDNVYIYIGMPYVKCGELFAHIRLKGKFDEDLSKFYIAQVILALEYMHYLGLIYRDLKPENILLETTGYIKLTDYGFAKLLSDSNYRTYSFCGTPEYLAPEIILSKGYGFAVDWWTVGVLIYEMNAGYSPFRKGSPMRLFEAITSAHYKFPEHFSKELRSLVSNLLVTNPMDRIGNLKNGAKDIKMDEWFKNFDWNGVFHRRLKPKYRPKPVVSETNINYADNEVKGFRTSANMEHLNEFLWLSHQRQSNVKAALAARKIINLH